MRIREGDPSLITLTRWEKFCFGMLDLAKRTGWSGTWWRKIVRIPRISTRAGNIVKNRAIRCIATDSPVFNWYNDFREGGYLSSKRGVDETVFLIFHYFYKYFSAILKINHNHRPCRWYAQAPVGPITSRAYRLITEFPLHGAPCRYLNSGGVLLIFISKTSPPFYPSFFTNSSLRSDIFSGHS